MNLLKDNVKKYQDGRANGRTDNRIHSANKAGKDGIAGTTPVQKLGLRKSVQLGKQPAGNTGKKAGNNEVNQLIASNVNADKFGPIQVFANDSDG